MRTKTLNDNTAATDPGGARVSEQKMRRFHPELFPRGLCRRLLFQLSRTKQYCRVRLEEHLMYGDSRAAMVVSAEPLVVAAYTEDMDCVALLKFPPQVLQTFPVKVGDRLLTVNLYGRDSAPQKDVELGPAASPHWNTFAPMIAEFFSDDLDRINERKSEICEAEWQRTWVLAQAYLARRGNCFRDGSPMRCATAARC